MLNQRQATVSTILSVLEARGVEYELNGETTISEVLTDNDKQQVRDELFTMFRQGEVSYREDFQAKVDDDSELKKYISGLVNNGIRKAKEFNNGQAYTPKNPGSRAHVGDAQLKAMMALKAQVQGTDAEDEVNEAIEQRKAEIAAEKAKSIEVNIDALPEHLKHLAQQ